MNKAIELLRNYSAKKILDVGTGRGDFLPVLKEGFENFEELIGIDVNETALEIAKEELSENRITFINMDASKINFDDESFDAVCISNSLHHLPINILTKVLVEMKRVLKQGGLFIINEMYCDNQSDKQISHVKLHHLNGQIDELLGTCHRETYRREQLVNLILSSGIRIESLLDYNLPEEQSINDSEQHKILEEIITNTGEKLNKISAAREYDELFKRYIEYKNTLLDIGFLQATELLMIGRKYNY